MAVTSAMILTLRRMVNEPEEAHGYEDDVLEEVIERYPLIDERGEAPYTWDTSTSPPTKETNEDWLATYDLNAAAADVWTEKATTKAELYTFSADGGQYVRSEVHAQFMRMAQFYRSRRAARNRRVFVA